jgi:signal transduction histidine kinase
LLFLKEFIKIQYQKIELANKLLEEESEERHILESLNIGIVIVDTKFLIKRYNQNFLIMFDIEESIENRPLKNTLPPHIFSLFLQLKEEIETKKFALEKIFDFTFTFGKTVKYALSISTFNYGGENNYIFIVRDLTYTQEIERLKSLDAQKNTFLAHVSHELKTPLTAIMGYVELLSQFETDPQKKTFLQNIYEQSQSMLQMIQNLITITKIELGKLKLNITQFDIVELTKKVIELFQTSKIHIFSTYFSPSQILIWADKEKVREILLNLISNAVKYSPQGGGIKVEIKTLPTTNSVQIAIADQGIGIPEESLPYIFEKFYRVENPLTAKIQGTGLGLSIVKGLVELHGGKISVKSVKDKGTTFFITLPVKKVLL